VVLVGPPPSGPGDRSLSDPLDRDRLATPRVRETALRVRISESLELVEAAGIEPATGGMPPFAEAGPIGANAGQSGAQVGHVEGVAVCPMCQGRTGGGQNVSNPGRGASTTGAQRGEGAGGADAELDVVVGLWADLPEPVRRAIIGAVRAFPLPSPSSSTQGTQKMGGSGGRSKSSRSAAAFCLRGFRGVAGPPSVLDTQVDTCGGERPETKSCSCAKLGTLHRLPQPKGLWGGLLRGGTP
jgi:hypothetical protein